MDTVNSISTAIAFLEPKLRIATVKINLESVQYTVLENLRHNRTNCNTLIVGTVFIFWYWHNISLAMTKTISATLSV